MEQLMTALPPRSAFGTLLRACRQRAHLSQEQLAARAELSERTVRELEADRVRSPRADTVRLLADALRLTRPQRDSWVAVAQGSDPQRARPGTPEVGASAPMPADARPVLGGCRSGSANGPRWHRPPHAEFASGTVAPRSDDGGPAGPVAHDSGPAGAAAQAQADQQWPDVSRLACADRWELAKLRRENGRLREEVEILKRATAILATQPR